MKKRTKKVRPADEHRGIQVNVRAESPEQLERWKRAAEREKRPLAQWVRLELDRAAERSGR